MFYIDKYRYMSVFNCIYIVWLVILARVSDNIHKHIPPNRHWVAHTSPRMVTIDGTLLLQQLIGPHPLTHEVAVVIMRRFGQIDDENSREAVGMKWRKFMDPDFAVCL